MTRTDSPSHVARLRALGRTFLNIIRPAALAALLLAPGVNAEAAPLAYVPNEGSGTVSVIDTETDRIVRTFSPGQKPRGIAVNRDGSRLYVSEQSGNALVTIDTANGKVLARTSIGDSPEALYLSPDGALLSAAIEENNEVVLIDTANGKIARRLKMRGKNPEHAVFSPDGKWLYV